MSAILSDEFYSKIKEVLLKDKRYRADAYAFVFQALDYTVKKVVKERRHLSGQELLQGIKGFALEQFGPLSKLVFTLWGVRQTSDFGSIVFNLVEKKLMGKTDQDNIEDFKDVYDFDEVFNMENILRSNKRSSDQTD